MSETQKQMEARLKAKRQQREQHDRAEKDAQREKIAADTEEFLKRGGKIEEVDYTANKYYNEKSTLNRYRDLKSYKRGGKR